MKVFLLERKHREWGEDYGAVVVAENEEHARRIASKFSWSFGNEENITAKEIDLNKEQCVLVAYGS